MWLPSLGKQNAATKTRKPCLVIWYPRAGHVKREGELAVICPLLYCLFEATNLKRRDSSISEGSPHEPEPGVPMEAPYWLVSCLSSNLLLLISSYRSLSIYLFCYELQLSPFPSLLPLPTRYYMTEQKWKGRNICYLEKSSGEEFFWRRVLRDKKLGEGWDGIGERPARRK